MLKLYEERKALVNEILDYIGVNEIERQASEEEVYDSITGLAEAIMAIREVDTDITGEPSDQLVNKILTHLAQY